MTRKELEQLIKQIEGQIEYCRKILEEEELSDEERKNIEEQIERQEEELNRLRAELEAMPREEEAGLVAVEVPMIEFEEGIQ